MEVTQSIQQYASYPIPHHLMTSLLKEYSQPNDKIHYLIKDGILQQVKRGLYVAGPGITSSKPDPFLLANHLLGPSYVSLESAGKGRYKPVYPRSGPPENMVPQYFHDLSEKLKIEPNHSLPVL